jgi:hypothetical protein
MKNFIPEGYPWGELKPWDAVDELWYGFRDPVAEGAPGAHAKLVALRSGNGWNIPFHGKIVRIEDGESSCADAAKEML